MATDDQEDLAKSTHEQFADVLALILPDGVPDDDVAAVIAGICGAVICNLWDRSDKRTEALRDLETMWRELGDSYFCQLKLETMQ